MRSIQKVFDIVVLLLLMLSVFARVPSAHAADATITVTGTADDTTVANLAGNGTCDLREAVSAAVSNSVVGECSAGNSGTDHIYFDIGGGGAQTINLVSPLEINDTVYMDGTSQPGYAGTPLIRITGASGGTYLLYLSNFGNSTIKGLQLDQAGTGGDAIYVYSNFNTIIGNYINTNGTASLTNSGTGILLLSSSYNTIGGSNPGEGNMFGGKYPLNIVNGFHNQVTGNTFGVQTDGSTALTGLPGINSVAAAINIASPGTSSAGYNTIRDNVITGYTWGVYLNGGDLTAGGSVSNNTVAGNLIGLGANGTTVLSNKTGIVIKGAANNTIGGLTAADRNVISGNTAYDIDIYDAVNVKADGNKIWGNYIGTNAAGTASVSMAAQYGINISGGTGNQIGGTEAGSGNVISGSTFGINIVSPSTGTIIRGNKIGTNKDGNAAIPNAYGVFIQSNANIGDSTTPGNNIISGNTPSAAVTIGTGTTTLYGNKIGVSAAGAPLANNRGVKFTTGASVAMRDNWIANTVFDGGVVILTGATVTYASENCITDNAMGVTNATTTAAPFAYNWWGDASGPSGVGPGSGDSVTSYVTYEPARTAALDICAPVVSLDDNSLDFGNQDVGTTSSAQTVTLTNVGRKLMTFTSITVPAPFHLGAGTCPASGGTLDVGASCTILVVFSPTVNADENEDVSIVTDANNSPTFINVVGTGVRAQVLLEPASLTFDDQRVGTTSTAQIVTFSNSGSSVLHYTSITAPAQFTLGTGIGACAASGGTLDVAASCYIVVEFSPTTRGTASGNISIVSGAGTSPDTIGVTGTGVQPTADLDHSTVDFGGQLVGSTSEPQTVTLTNNGNTYLTVSGITTSAPYSLGTGTCPLTSDWTLGAGGSCTILISFSPTAEGSAPGSVTITSDASSSPDHITLSGTGGAGSTTGELSLSTSALTFPAQLLGTTSSAQSVTLTNTGTGSLAITSITTSAPYSLGAGTCPKSGGTVNAGASCTILVKFSPTVVGPAPARSITITSNAGSSPDHVTLSGSGTKGTQLLKNPSFETDANADSRPDRFTYTKFNPATDSRDCSVRKAGKCSLRLVGNGLPKTVTQTIVKSGAAGQDFTFSLWSQSASVPKGSIYRLQVSFYNGSTLLTTKTMNFTAGTHGFKKVSGIYTSPSPFTKIVFRITFKAASGNAWFDVGALSWAP